jgi:hypothetical protein
VSILNIEPASRNGMRLMISLFGLSESGKTLSALKLASGIEPNPAKRGMLDTEGGQRGRAYVDHIDGGYLYGALTPPFTPERYIEAISEFEKAGVSVLVIDSISHSWNAQGGILDIVEQATEKNDMAKWAKPKRRLSKMVQRILASDMHIILCSRAKQPLIEIEGENGRKKLAPGPVVPIQEKSLRYDMTIMSRMLGDGRFSIDSADGGKCPGILRPLFATSQTMNEDMGRKLVEWLGKPAGKTPEQRFLETRATDMARHGTAAFKEYWATLKPDQKEMLRPIGANLGSIAKAADEGEADRADDEPQTGEPMQIEQAA